MPRSTLLAAAALTLLAAVPAGAAAQADPAALVEALQQAWTKADVNAWLEAWRFRGSDERELERQWAEDQLQAESVQLHIEQLPAAVAQVRRVRVPARFFRVLEPRGEVSQAMLTFERGDDGWAVVAREQLADIDGLIHLSLDRKGFDAAGITLRLPDLEVRLEQGTLFTAPASVGPTVLVFSGKGVVDFNPGPATEKEQLRQYSGKTRLVQPIRHFFFRLHPAKIFEWLGKPQLLDDPRAASRYDDAADYYARHVSQIYLLDAALPRSPWWLVPPLGDGALVFDGPKGPLTYTLDDNAPEGLSLFDRVNRRQVCLYAANGKSVRYSDEDNRSVDVIRHDLAITFENGLRMMRGDDTVRVAVRQPIATLRLRLHDSFAVESITSAEVGPLLFFRVRGQDSVMVSLGSLGAQAGSEVAIRVRYRGYVPAAFVEDEAMAPQIEWTADDMHLEDVKVLTNRTSWYPSIGPDDYATATIRFDLPAELTAVTGGERVSSRVEGGRRIVEYRQDRKGKYISAAVGRLVEGPTATTGSTTIRSFAVTRQAGDLPQKVQQAQAILAYFETLFGPAPYSTLNLTLIERETPGGHSPPGMVVLAERPVLLRRPLRDDPATFWDIPGFFLAHELAHQWWGHGVTGENYHERWISEGFAQYAAALWVRHSRGEDTFREALARMDRWAVRMTDQGPISLGYRLGHVKGDPQVFRAIVYDKAALVLHLLRGIVGDEGFFAALRKLQADSRFSTIGTADVQAALETAHGASLQPYFDAWVYGTELPTVTLRYANEAGGKAVVELAADGLPGPIPVAIELVSGAGRTTRQVTLPPAGASWTFDDTGISDVSLRADMLPLMRVRREKGRPGSYSR
jgi:hypothetical protein